MTAWLYPWIGLGGDEDPGSDKRPRLEDELRLEVGPGHVLHGAAARAIARRRSADDVVFALEDGRVALVHLTWARRREEPPFPGTVLHVSLDAWRRDVMVPDHEGYDDEE